MFEVYEDGQEYHSIVAGYASTVHEVMGQTLSHMTLAFSNKSPAIGYVALSRVFSLDNIVSHMTKTHFVNLKHGSNNL